jgi:hypothetical protein
MAVVRVCHVTSHLVKLLPSEKGGRMRLGVAPVLGFLMLSVIAQGQVIDPFDQNVCQGPSFSTQDAATYFSPGTSQMATGTYYSFARLRICTHLTGCTSWNDTKFYLASGEYYAAAKFVMALQLTGASPYFEAKFATDWSWGHPTVNLIDSSGSLLGNAAVNIVYPQVAVYLDRSQPWTGFLKQHCAWFKWTGSSKELSDHEWYEYETVLYGTH